MPTVIAINKIPGSTLLPHEEVRIKEVAEFIGQNISKHYTIQQLSMKCKIPEKSLKRLFQQYYGVGLFTFLLTLRMEAAKELILAGIQLKDITSYIGYESESTFCRAFRRFCKESPIEWKNKRHVLHFKRVP